MKIGKDSVVMGNVPQNIEVGEGCVVIGPTDARGNTIINQPMAIGRNAQAGTNSIAIGAGANAGEGFNLVAAIHELSNLAQQSNNLHAVGHLSEISGELKKAVPDKSLILKSWDAVKAAGSIDGAYNLVAKVSQVLASL